MFRVALAFFVALSVSSAHTQTQQHLIERYYRDAQIAFQQGNARHARDLLAKILELRNDIPEVHNLLAAASDRLGDSASAQKHFELALGLNPDYVEARENLALYWIHRGDLAQAAAHLERAAKLKPGDERLLAQLGRLYLLLDRFEASVAALERLGPASPLRNREYALTLARALERL